MNHADIQGWCRAPSRWSGAIESDALILRQEIGSGEALRSAFPPKAERTSEQQQFIDLIDNAARQRRYRFLIMHAAEVYAAARARHAAAPSLAALAYAAAELFPGLVPTRAQMQAECQHRQSLKDGREIDQGLFFRELLRNPVAGRRIVREALLPTGRALSLLPALQSKGQLDLGAVRIERHGHAAHLTIANAAHLNSEDTALVEDLETAVDLALLDPAVGVVVLRGARMTHPRYQGRRVFSAGINLKNLHQGKIPFVEFLLRRELGFINKIAYGLWSEDRADSWRQASLAKPCIAAVDTFAIGGGAQILLVFDHVIASADSYFSLPAAQEGIIPGAANLRLAKRTDGRLAKQIILGGKKVWAHEPDASLLFDQVVDPASMDAAIADSVVRFHSPAVVANRHMLRLAEEPLDEFRTYIAEFALEQAVRMYSVDVLAKVEPRGKNP